MLNIEFGTKTANFFANVLSMILCGVTTALGIVLGYFIVIGEVITTTYWESLFIFSMMPIGLMGIYSMPPEQKDGIPRLFHTFAWGIACAFTISVICSIFLFNKDLIYAKEMIIILGLVAGAVRYFGETHDRNKQVTPCNCE